MSTLSAIGGERLSVVDPWSWPANLVRRLSGRPRHPAGDMWMVPVER